MFYDPNDFDFARTLSANFDTIHGELSALDESDFVPWIERGLYEGDGWKVFPLFSDGPYDEVVPVYEGNRRRCPRTLAVLRSLPGCVTAGFSLMKPGTYIVPHCGSERGVYRCHLCLVEGSDCGLRFGDDTRDWRRQECLVFEDTIMHDAWNRGDRNRIVLLADFLKSEYPGAH